MAITGPILRAERDLKEDKHLKSLIERKKRMGVNITYEDVTPSHFS
jgi:hypothetical protein